MVKDREEYNAKYLLSIELSAKRHLTNAERVLTPGKPRREVAPQYLASVRIPCIVDF
jgi:hypothetical protein